jgi:hypothetical protein
VTGALSRSNYIFSQVKLACHLEYQQYLTRFESNDILFGAAEGAVFEGIAEQRWLAANLLGTPGMAGLAAIASTAAVCQVM